jgi:opacity protein-like surface antigen
MNSKKSRTCSAHGWAILLALAGMLLPVPAQIPMATDPLSRAGKTEFYGIGQYLHSSDITFDGPYGDIKTKMDDTGLGGFGAAYHFNDFFSLRADFMFGGATFSADVPTSEGSTMAIKQDALIQTGRLNVDWNMINRRITPFVTVGIGYQYMETELENAPPVGGWYYDPWYGYVYYYDHPVAWQTDFTWNAGVGFRWNVTDTLFIKASANATWLEYSGAKGITTQLEGIFCIGYTF